VVVVVHHLDEQLPFRVVASFDGAVEVLRVRAQFGGLDLGGLRGGQRLDSELRNPVVLDQLRLILRVDPLVGVDAETLHRAVGRRDAARAEHHADHVHRLRRLTDEVEHPVGRLPLEVHRVGLLRVDQVRELDRVANEEHREVVADEVPVAVLGVELHRKATRVTRHLRGVAAAGDGGEPDGEIGALALDLEQLGAGEAGDVLVAHAAVRLEVAEGRRAAGMHDPLRYPLAVEVADLLQELVVLQRRRATRADLCAGSGCRGQRGPAGWSAPGARQPAPVPGTQRRSSDLLVRWWFTDTWRSVRR